MLASKQWLEKVTTELKIEKKFGMGQELAKTFGINNASISEQVRGKTEVGTDQAKKIARILGVAPMLVIASTSYHRCIKLGKLEEAENWKTIYERTLIKEETATKECVE